MHQTMQDSRAQLALVWGAKWFILGTSLIFMAGALATAFILPPQYEGVVVLSPVSATNSAGPSGVASELGGLAALAGISSAGDAAKNEALAVLQSETLTEAYVQRNNLLPILYSEDWDSSKMMWRSKDPEKIPTLWKANRLFDRKLRKITTGKSGIVTLTITWRDPKYAAIWANGLVRMANDYIREQSIQQSERNISYLNAEAAKTNIVEVKQAVYSIMRTEINKTMIARSSEEYAFKVIDPAKISEIPASPRKQLWSLGGMTAGFFFAVFVVIARYSLQT